jgi:hypothetical protein
MTLDRRDIETLIYCVRIAESNGRWPSPRTPHELECKLAGLLRAGAAPPPRRARASGSPRH